MVNIIEDTMTLEKFGKQCGCGIAIIGGIAALMWGGIEYDGRKANASEVQQIQKDLATLTTLIKEDKITQAKLSLELEIFRIEKLYATIPMPAAELNRLLFLKAQLQALMDLEK